MKFYIPMVPPKATAQQHSILRFKDGTTRIGHKEAGSAHKAKQTYWAALYAFKPEKPLEGPLRLALGFVWPWRASESAKAKAAGYIFSPVRPDADNLSKLVCDAMTSTGYWCDDSQVASLHVTKGWGERHGLYVSLESLGEEAVEAKLSSLTDYPEAKVKEEEE